VSAPVRRRGPSIGGLIRFAIAAGLTAWYLFWKTDPSQTWAYVTTARLTPLLTAIGLVLIDRTLMAWRWLLLLRPYPAARRVAFFDLLRVFFISSFVGTFLPASVGGDAVRAASMARLRVPLADAVASVFMDRVLGVLSVLVMAVLGLALAYDLPARTFVLVSLVVTAAGCAAAAVMTFSTRGARAMVYVLNYVPIARVRKAGGALIEAVQRYATHHGMLSIVLLASIGVQILRIIQAYYLGRALNLDTPLSAYFAFIPVILLVMLMPITINGIGTGQVAFGALFTHANMPASGAFALSVLFIALGIVGNLPGGLLYAWGGVGPSAPANGPAPAPAAPTAAQP
jgi:uncharacterized protein (TIRG00374 family)